MIDPFASFLIFSMLLLTGSCVPHDALPLLHLLPLLAVSDEPPLVLYLNPRPGQSRRNLLITRLKELEIYEDKPFSSATVKLLHRFPAYLCVPDIIQLALDHFAVITGNLAGTPLKCVVPKLFSIQNL